MAMNDVSHHQTHLFMLRLWIEDLGDGRAEWRGKVQHVLSGEASYFRDWQTLLLFIHAHSDSGTGNIQPYIEDEGQP